MQTSVPTVSRRLLLMVAALIWLAPAGYWLLVEGRGAPQNPTLATGAADCYYSFPDRRYYALVATDTITVSHDLPSPASLSRYTEDIAAPERLHDLMPAGQPLPVHLQPGKQTLVAQNQLGDQAILNLLHSPVATSMGLLTRTLELSLSEREATATYVAVAPADAAPSDITDVLSGTMEPGLFIKRVFYTNQQPGSATGTQCRPTDDSFRGDEVSIIQPASISIKDKLIRVIVHTRVSGWRYQPEVIRRLLGVLPLPGVSTRVIFRYAQGTLRSLPQPIPSHSWDAGEIIWDNPAAPIVLTYDFRSPQTTTARARDLPLMLVAALDPLLAILRSYDFFFSLLTTLFVPLLPWIWLRRLHRSDRVGTWRRFALPLSLNALLWLGPLGAMGLSFVLFGQDSARAGSSLWVAFFSSALVVLLLSAPATAPRLAARLRIWSGQGRVRTWVARLTLALFLTALMVVLLANRNTIWRYALTFPLQGFLLALAGWSLVRTINTEPRLHIFRPIWVAWAGALIVLAAASPYTVHLYDPIAGWPPQIARNLFLPLGSFVMPYLGLLCALTILKAHSANAASPSGLALFVFVLLVGLTGTFPQVWLSQSEATYPVLLSPIPFLLAWLLFRFLLRPLLSQEIRSTVFARRNDLLAPDAPPGDSVRHMLRAFPPPPMIRHLALAFGPQPEDWDNGRLGARYGAILGGAITVLYCALLLPGVADQIESPFLPMILLVAFILPIFLRWVLSGFFLGYFFAGLRGRNGALKGLCLAAVIAASVFIYDLFFRVRTSADLQIFFALDVVLTILGLMGLGAMLDVRTIREEGYPAAHVLSIYRVPFLAGYISALAAGMTATTIGLINGQVAALVDSLVKALLVKGI